MASELLKVSHTAGVTNSESVLINGVSGHTYTILEDDTVVYEYKTGPYTGVENDKVFLNDHR